MIIIWRRWSCYLCKYSSVWYPWTSITIRKMSVDSIFDVKDVVFNRRCVHIYWSKIELNWNKKSKRTTVSHIRYPERGNSSKVLENLIFIHTSLQILWNQISWNMWILKTNTTYGVPIQKGSISLVRMRGLDRWLYNLSTDRIDKNNTVFCYRSG